MTAFAQPITDADRHLDELKDVIRRGSAGMARSLQTAIGPSEVGIECSRRLAYKIVGKEPVNPPGDPQAALFGTGMHALYEGFFRKENERLGYQRYWIEEKVHCGPITGSCDLYDAKWKTVVDWKFPGLTAFKNYQKNGPSDQYQVQAHMYGLGHETAGREVERVALAMFSRSGNLTSSLYWSEAYDRSVALAAIERVQTLRDATHAWLTFTGGDLRATYDSIPASPSYLCGFCPYFLAGSTDSSGGCAGEELTRN